VPHLLLVAEIQQAPAAVSCAAISQSLPVLCLLNEVENPPFQRIVTSFGAFCNTCVSSTSFRERGESNFGSERSRKLLNVLERYLGPIIPREMALRKLSRRGGGRTRTACKTGVEAMKLNATQVKRTLSQFDAEVLPDSHPVVPQLNTLFGDHTFFLDSDGLNVLEPAETPEVEGQAGEVISLASWSDATLTSLRPHEPEPTGVVIVLESQH
jgi:hypothetical protein